MGEKMGEKKEKITTLSVPPPVPYATEAAGSLLKAIEGWGRNGDAVQRNLLRASIGVYEEYVIGCLKSKHSDHFQKAVLLFIFDPIEREAILANIQVGKVIPHPDLRVIVEIACIGSRKELLEVKKAYKLRYKNLLEDDVWRCTTGDVRKLLVALVGPYRCDSNEIDEGLAAKEAKIIRDAIKTKAFCDEEIIRILATRSKAQLNATFKSFTARYETIDKLLPADDGNDYIMVLRATIRAISSPLEYFAELLRTAISKPGTDEHTLTRVIVGRAEKDLKGIKEVYDNDKKNNHRLAEAIAKGTSGNYHALLLALIRRN